MQTTARVLNVFLASPDDVKDERIAADRVVGDVDKFIGRVLGWNIQLYKWEDTSPATGRPQEIINAAVDNCDLFIGLLWERWGQPSGQYSSGFEEEYERARSRRKQTGRPEIWLVFKEVDPGKRKDAGPQLSRVLEFQEKRSREREFFYGEIEDVDDWKRKLRNWLDQHVLKLQAPEREQPPASAPQSESLAAATTNAAVTAEKQARIPKQLAEVAESLTKTIKSGELEFSAEDAKLLQEFDIARLFLLSATWMSRRYTGNTLGTHEVNLLYKHRGALKMTPVESLQVFRALLVNPNTVIPGWFWFSDLKAEVLRNSLLSLSRGDLSEDVRQSALQLMREAGLRLPKRLWPALPLADNTQGVRSAAYAYLGLVGDDDMRSELEAMDFGDADFAAIRQRSADRIRQRLGDKAVETALEQFKQYDDFIRSMYLAVALSALAAHGEPSDIKFGRQYMGSTYSSVKLAAVRIVCRFGTSEDSADLLRVSSDAYGDVRDEAGIGALRLSPRPVETARELTQSPSAKIAQAAFGRLYTQDSPEVRRFFEELLNGDSDANRVRAIFYFSKTLDRKKLIKLLKAQFNRNTYYYNVVAWLDRLLYSPRALRGFFLRELERQAFDGS